MVLTANGQLWNGHQLWTCALRPEMIFGPGDNHFVPQILDKVALLLCVVLVRVLLCVHLCLSNVMMCVYGCMFVGCCWLCVWCAHAFVVCGVWCTDGCVCADGCVVCVCGVLMAVCVLMAVWCMWCTDGCVC